MFPFSGRGAAPKGACITAIVDGTGMLGPLATLLADQYSRDGNVRLLAPASALLDMADKRSIHDHGEAHELQTRLEILAPRFDSIIIDATGTSKLFVRTALIAAHRAVIAVAAEGNIALAPARLLEDIRLFNPRLQTWLAPASLQPVASQAPAVSLMLASLPGARVARAVLRPWRLEEDVAHLYRELSPAYPQDATA